MSGQEIRELCQQLLDEVRRVFPDSDEARGSEDPWQRLRRVHSELLEVSRLDDQPIARPTLTLIHGGGDQAA